MYTSNLCTRAQNRDKEERCPGLICLLEGYISLALSWETRSKIDEDGSATVDFQDGKIHTVKPGDIFYVSSKPHDSWVLGDEEYVSIHFLGAEDYAD